MRIQYCSDLHFNFQSNVEFILKSPLKYVGDILILAGDTTFLNYHEREFERQFFKTLSDNYKYVFYLIGNSEFYGGVNCKIIETPFFKKIFHNFFVVNNYCTTIDSCTIIFTTLWSHINDENKAIIKNNSHDFEYIRYDNKPISEALYNRFHAQATTFINNKLKNINTKTTIVVSHFLPSMLCSSDKWKGNPLNDVFVANMDDIIINNKIDYWIYGHSHENMPPIYLGNTVLLTNQFAESYNDNKIPFNNTAYIDV